MMDHWSSKYIGQPYAEADCAMLAVQVLNAEFNRDIQLPAERPDSVFSLSSLINQRQQDYAKRTDHPQEGDAVLMRSRGRLNHIGIYCLIDQQPYVLHAMRNSGQTCRHKLSDLARYQLTLEGFYQWL